MDRDSPSVLSFYIGENKMQKFEKVQNICYSNLIWGFDGTSIILRHPKMISLGDYINFSKSLFNMH